MGKPAHPRAGDRIDGLDLLRFLLAFAVVVYHLAYRMPQAGFVPGITTAPDELLYGRYAVQAFFVISGMVIAASARHRSFADFAINRIVRLQPAILICASITLLSSVFLATGREPVSGVVEWASSSLLVPLLATNQWQADWSYWSLTLELRFYLLAGIFFLFFRSTRAIFTAVAIWLAASLGAMLSGQAGLEMMTISSAAPCFALGVLIHIYATEPKSRPLALCLGLVALALMPLQLMQPVEHAWQAIGWVEAIAITLAIVALVLAATTLRNLGRFSRIARVLGAASYPLYLVHQFVGYHIIGRLMQAGMVWELAVVAAILIVTAIAFVVAMFAEPLVAKRLRALLQSLRKPAPKPASAVA